MEYDPFISWVIAVLMMCDFLIYKVIIIINQLEQLIHRLIYLELSLVSFMPFNLWVYSKFFDCICFYK